MTCCILPSSSLQGMSHHEDGDSDSELEEEEDAAAAAAVASCCSFPPLISEETSLPHSVARSSSSIPSSRRSVATAAAVSPTLVAAEFRAVAAYAFAGAGAADGAGSLVIKPSTTAREVIARYEIDESALELIVRLPSAYPLAQAEVSCEERVGVSESRLRKWTLGVAAILKHQNGAVAQSLDRWRRNVDAEFSGVEPCPICYAVVHPVDHQKPRLRCRQCDNAFHAACLYTWFRTSSKSSCPLCVTPWGSSYR